MSATSSASLPANGSPTPTAALPRVLAGPILRRVTAEGVMLWLVTSRPQQARVWLLPEQDATPPTRGEDGLPTTSSCRLTEHLAMPLGEHAWLLLIEAHPDTPLPADCAIAYELGLAEPSSATAASTATEAAASSSVTPEWQGIADWAPQICYPGESLPRFRLPSRLTRVAHGSCRKPHHGLSDDEQQAQQSAEDAASTDRLETPPPKGPGGDGLVALDRWLSERRESVAEWPEVMLFTGDQIYADDVAGPMLGAIDQLIAGLGLPEETLMEAEVSDTRELRQHPSHLYHRPQLLPDMPANEGVAASFFGAKRKPIFTSTGADNHLIGLSEVIAMYLLVWSDVPWEALGITLEDPSALEGHDDATRERHATEARHLRRFCGGLGQVRRLLANVPSLMIFDDHDVTDDWNLSAAWEEAAYGHPFSRRIIGNALTGYLLCQAAGNGPEPLAELLEETRALFTHALTGTDTAADGHFDVERQEALIAHLHRCESWDYQLDTTPPLIVADTRTRRWRSERKLSHPSGLMDWEALSELQQRLVGHPAVVLVSPAPMFGVKLIESIQKLFTLAGKPLMVDAENWMAHRGAASVMLNIFRHSRTPQNFVILSGDVHYSFAYDVRLKHRRSSPSIWQITSSGIRNRFPVGLLDVLDRLNHWLYAPRSPLNLLTRRRNMRVTPRRHDAASQGERLLNACGIGLVDLDSDGRPTAIRQLTTDGQEVHFVPRR
ncbi:alkaline phosphatase D family protein [Cobetia sp. D5]|uniref:alkaline phosphatase D family protein n=1 Tax=unclassified Cobetia TaxID=2609414 RepID=UPI002447B155|nr:MULTISPECIES: alkaline phosphatase D family protein [unclassified Cobetia]MDH2298591.1 alkaline phosphatase D family protein [Cobetia sp. 29-18-1]